MQGRNVDLRWTLVLTAVALACVLTVLVGRHHGEAPPRTHAVTQPTRISETLGSREFRSPAAPTLMESLRAADLLVKAGKLAPPPTLMESLQAADLLVKAGKLARPPTLMESLQAADLLVKAGKLAPPPTLMESLQAADLLVKAGKLAPPPTLIESLQAAVALVKAGKLAPPPPLIDILRAASILADAKAAPAAQDPAPPPVAPDTPQAPALAEIPVPPANAPAPSAANGAGGYFDDGFTAQLFSLVNQRRQAAGLRPLAVDPRLANSAATYTKVLAGNDWFSHTGPDGSTLVTRDEAAGFPFTVQLGEVLAWGSDGWTAAEIVQAWIDSPAHRDQVLSSAYTRGGAGCYFTNTGNTTVRCAMELAG